MLTWIFTQQAFSGPSCVCSQGRESCVTEWCPEKDVSVRLSSCRSEPWQLPVGSRAKGFYFIKCFSYYFMCVSVCQCLHHMHVCFSWRPEEGGGWVLRNWSSVWVSYHVGLGSQPTFSARAHCCPSPELFAKENSLLSCEERADRKCWSTCVWVGVPRAGIGASWIEPLGTAVEISFSFLVNLSASFCPESPFLLLTEICEASFLVYRCPAS